jgi:hypothetical protein
VQKCIHLSSIIKKLHKKCKVLNNALYSTRTTTQLYWNFLGFADIISNLWLMSLPLVEARGSVVGWGTMLQGERSRVRFPTRSLNYFQFT